MADKDFERLSASMDGEQPVDDELLAELENDANAAATWQRYHLIRTVMRDGHSELDGVDMVARIHRQLEDEPVVLAPGRMRHPKPDWFRQAVGMAIAATVAVVAVLVIQPGADNDASREDVLAAAGNAAPTVRVTSHERLSRAAEARLSAYIVNHNEVSSMAGVQSIPAYTRIISSTPGERVGK